MKITEAGKYKLLEDITYVAGFEIATLKRGTIIEIDKIDKNSCKVIGKALLDWFFWEMPVEPVNM